MNSKRSRLLLSIRLAVVGLVLAGYGYYRFAISSPPNESKTFDGPSSELKHTQIVATLDEPIETGKNAIWCASFLAAWKALEKDLAGEPIAMDGAPPMVAKLNAAPDPRPEIPDGALYATAGWANKGIIREIEKNLRAKFPGKAMPTFPEIAQNSFVAYGYLEAWVKFPVLYIQNEQPLDFVGGDGETTRVTSFGIRDEDVFSHADLRKQARVIFRKGDPSNSDMEFAVDLCSDSSPSQIVVARIRREPTLGAALRRLKNELAQARKEGLTDSERKQDGDVIGDREVLLVPDMCWEILHHFAEVEGKHFTNAKLQGQSVDVAKQDLFFRMDRAGVELRAEVDMYAKSAAPPPPVLRYVFDGPFLLYMTKRDAETPYFAMWVDNAELLRSW